MEDSSKLNVVFTVCSNNYLAQAATLQKSLAISNPDWKFIIALVDRYSTEVDYSIFKEGIITELNESIIPGYKNMISRYAIVELNTAIKPFFFEYLNRKFPEAASLVYLDPDIYVYGDLTYLNTLLEDAAILLTPHFLTPVPLDGLNPPEHMVLNFGLYNLGFIAVDGKKPETRSFLRWWGERTFNYGYHNIPEGLFVDQLWINLVPLFFKQVKIIRHFGLNVGPWNLYERTIRSVDGNQIYLSNGDQLLFYHFSSFDPKNPTRMSFHYNRTAIKQNPNLANIYRRYGDELKAGKVEYYSTLRCELPLITYNPPLKSRIIGPVISFARRLWKKI